MSRFIKIDQLEPGMVVDRGVFNRYGKALIFAGTRLEGYEINALKLRGIKGLYIKGEGEDDAPELLAKVPDIVKANIEFHEEADPNQVMFTQAVKNRISKGIEYLYNNIDTPEMDETAASITNEIMTAMDQNGAVAVDLNILKASDEYTFKHSVDVATIGMVVARHIGFDNRQIYEAGIAALLHDVGKSRVPLEILNKTARLTDEEFEVMKKHSQFGYDILKERKKYNDTICISVLQHHEKVNGGGYPFGYKGDQITPYAKLISVADVYDALVTDRPYKKAFPQGDAVEMIMSMSSEMDMDTMGAFLSSVILYPVKSLVRLSNGEVAQVVKNYENTPLRPKVVGLRTGKVYNLHEDMDCINIVVSEVVHTGGT